MPPKQTLATLFCDTLATVVFQTSDNVIFRVHDYYLKAASEFFRDMLESSVASSSSQTPIPVDETAEDFEIMLRIITGQGHGVLAQPPATWYHAARIYRLVGIYQLDGHQNWFSALCESMSAENPMEALIQACDRPTIDTILARNAILEGFTTANSSNFNQMFDARYFRSMAVNHDCDDAYGNVEPLFD
ncbi:hypothetical protein QFC19_000035 [Naganishia cerealis]|uniref:Uncharacterized protein n=1 Tax=Naganishia cerealis TaxID=610337 RepID=A0ACC2WQC1_9TREE|nr:hypothetical protein QFC19_000035 [Naganishia cerealis]